MSTKKRTRYTVKTYHKMYLSRRVYRSNEYRFTFWVILSRFPALDAILNLPIMHYSSAVQPATGREAVNKLTSVFCASVLLLIINCVITVSNSSRRQTFAVSLPLRVQCSELLVFAMNIRRLHSIFVCFIYG